MRQGSLDRGAQVRGTERVVARHCLRTAGPDGTLAAPHGVVQHVGRRADIKGDTMGGPTLRGSRMGHSARTRTVTACGVVAVLAVGALVADAATAPALTPLIPAYFPATGTATDPWKTVPPAAKANGTPAIEVMNVDSGPGTNIGVSDPTASGLAAYDAAISAAHASGSSVYGYVWTNFANTGAGPAAPIATVETQINQWVNSYPGIDGIFFDGASSVQSGVSFYQAIDTYAHAKGLRVIFNPGTVPAQSYMAIDPTSIVVDFEGSASTYTKASFPSWTLSYPASRFANLVYSASATQVPTIAAEARRDNVGNLYATNLKLPNPYGALANYFLASELPAFAAK